MDKRRVIADAVRPYLPLDCDSGAIADEVLRQLAAAGFGWIDPYATRQPRIYTDEDHQVWSDS